MQLHRFNPPNANSREDRKGTATVEFAVTAPLFLSLVLGIAEMSRALDVSQTMAAAVREGGRLAAMDLTGMVPAGMTSESKVTEDIRNMITASGIDGSQVIITIKHTDGPNQGLDFDFDDENNYLAYFTITAQVDYGDISYLPGNVMDGQIMKSAITLRMGRGSMSD